MKLGMLVNPDFLESLGSLLTKELPPKTAFKLKGSFKRVQEEIKKYEEVRQENLKKLGKKDDKGELITDKEGKVEFEPGAYEEMVNKLKDLQDLEVEIPSVKLDELGSKIDISVKDLALLEGLIVE